MRNSSATRQSGDTSGDDRSESSCRWRLKLDALLWDRTGGTHRHREVINRNREDEAFAVEPRITCFSESQLAQNRSIGLVYSEILTESYRPGFDHY